MFTLPSIANIVVSTIIFFVAVWYLRRVLDEHEIPQGMTRSLLVFTLASLVSWGAGAVVDRIQGPQQTAAASGDLSQLLKAVDQAQP